MTGPVKPPTNRPPKRPYHSTVRAEHVRLTRSRILDAAERLFLADGYGSTTIAAIAVEAEVAADTVYATLGSKRGILQALMDVRVVGDDEPAVLLDREEALAAEAEVDSYRRAGIVAGGIATIHERSRRIDDLMLSAAGSDPEVAALRNDIQQRQRLEGMRRAAQAIKGRDQLRDNLDDECAAEILWAVASPDVHRLLRGQRLWSAEEYRTWLADAIRRLLLP